MNLEKQYKFKTINKTTLAKAYDIPPRTLKLWLKPIESEIGMYVGKSFSPNQVAKIIQLLGVPENLQLIICN